jgi:hypothetical protein
MGVPIAASFVLMSRRRLRSASSAALSASLARREQSPAWKLVSRAMRRALARSFWRSSSVIMSAAHRAPPGVTVMRVLVVLLFEGLEPFELNANETFNRGRNASLISRRELRDHVANALDGSDVERGILEFAFHTAVASADD